jgi:multicomponent K+:H+ antiporter subunit G
MPESFWEILVAAHLFIGGGFVLVGSLGLLRLQNTMARMHGPSKATTVGIGGILVASIIYFGLVVEVEHRLFAAQDVLIVLFLFLTAPISAHFMSKAYMHKYRDEAGPFPETRCESGWATYEPPPKKPS